MLAGKVEINTLQPGEAETLRAALTPLVKEDVDALDKAGKPASKMLEDYSR